MARPVCLDCERPVQSKGHGRWGKRCSTCHRARYDMRGTGYRLFKKDYCELCGFIPVNDVQLDVDHIDGNKQNDNPTNLQTLCANCHRLKTFLNADWS